MIRSAAFAGVMLTLSMHAADPPSKLEYACPPEDIDAFGLPCSVDDPCPVFLDLSAVESTGIKLFISGNLHTQSTTLYAVLLASEDGGRTWTEPIKRIPASVLEEIQFIDFATGWVSGERAESLPRDPFLLLTTDGGKTWRNRPVSEESRVGSISQFWFDSKTQGELVIDHRERGVIRHEVFQSNTGGESWEMKESTTSPVKLKARKDDSGWRVRADSASKTFRLERRSGAAWEPVASFLIHVADCK